MEKYQAGNRVTGVINNITDLGIFVTLPNRHSGLVHHSDFGNNWLRERRRYHVGDEVRVVVVHIYKGRFNLSITRVNDPKLVDHDNQFSKTKPADFDQVLNQTTRDAKEEIEKLKQVLTEKIGRAHV